MVLALPPEQRGWLLTALLEYGAQLAGGEDVPLEQVLEGLPQLSAEARMVCGFMGANIRRDTQRWLARQRSRSGDVRSCAPPTPQTTRSNHEVLRQILAASQAAEEVRKERG